MGDSENIIALFTDLVGSTKLSSTVTPAEADKVRREHFAVLRRAVEASGGVEVKNLGDGLMVAFATASAALSCAVTMQQEVERENRASGRQLGLRVGLSGGEVTREAEDYFGDPVIEAARLCAKAEAGQILATGLVRAMAGRRNAHPFRELGELELKGLPEPVETLEVGWSPADAVKESVEAVPLPTRLAHEPGVGIVGRQLEADILAEAFKRVTAGEGREVVLIAGEAGLGKTTMAADAARRAFADGAFVLLGRSSEDLGAPYGPFIEALGHFVANGSEELLAVHVQACGGELARMVPSLGRRLGELPSPQSTDPETERFLLFGAVTGLLSQMAISQPVVLVLDDLQWADKPSLQLLRHVVSNAESMRLLIIGTYRDSELSTTHPLTETLGALRREPGVSRIELKGLDDRGVLAYLEAAAGHDLDQEGVSLAWAVYSETDGNPFFVGEVLRHLSETGAIYQDEGGHWATALDLAEMALPDSIREVVSARVSRLGESAGQVLSVASVIGRDFDMELVVRLTAFGEEEVLDILDGAIAASLVRELPDVAGRYGFSHALIQHTLYQDLGPTRRARVHRQIAEALEAVYGDHPGDRVGELAHHWFAATQPTDLAKAFSYSRQAAEAALAALAPEDAVRYFAQALQLLDQMRDVDPSLRVDLLLGLGVAERQAGIPAHRRTLLNAAAEASRLHDTDRLVRAALANNRGSESSPGEIDWERVAVVEEALESLGSVTSIARARLLANLARELTYGPDPARRMAVANEACELARRLNDPVTLVHCLNARAGSLRLPETLEERRVSTREALQLALALEEPELEFSAHRQRLQAALESGDCAEAHQATQVMYEIAKRVGSPFLLWNSLQDRALCTLLAGEVSKAEEFVEEAFQVGTKSGQPDALITYSVQLLDVRTHQGRTGELVDMLAAALPDVRGLPAMRAAVARGFIDAQRPREAEDLLNSSDLELPRDELWLVGMSIWAFVAARLKRRDEAMFLYEALKGWSGLFPSAVVALSEPVDHCLGELAAALDRVGPADDHFAAAEKETRRLQAPFYVARTLVERARLDLVLHNPVLARERLAEAKTLASRHGYARVSLDVETLEALATGGHLASD